MRRPCQMFFSQMKETKQIQNKSYLLDILKGYLYKYDFFFFFCLNCLL